LSLRGPFLNVYNRIMTTTLAALAFILLPAPDGEQLLREVQDHLSNGKSLTLRFRATVDLFGELHSGTLKVKGEKYSVDYVSRASGEKWVEKYDGKKRRVLFEGGKTVDRPPVAGFAAYLTAAAALSSLGEAYTRVLESSAKESPPVDQLKFSEVTVTEVKDDTGRKFRLVKYTLTTPGGKGQPPDVAKIDLWVDAEKPIAYRREVAFKGGKLVESYAGHSTAELDDAQFDVP